MKKIIKRREFESILFRQQAPSPSSGRRELVESKEDFLPLILQQIYVSRGIHSIGYIDKSLDQLLPIDALSNIQQASELIHHALRDQKRILVIGDFDADGATSSTLAVKALRAFGAKTVEFLVPNRFEYGYGLTPEIVKVALQWKPDLIITVDNGIASLEGVQFAKENHIQVLITDHHLPGASLPKADAIVNPNLSHDLFPSKNLAGVGVIFYVMLALRRVLREANWFIEKQIPEPNMSEFLDLVALGTVADVVTLDKNNRILVHQGIQRIRKGKCSAGVKALLTIGKRNWENVIAQDLAFVAAPRLNAAGRLDDMALGITCLLEPDFQKAMEYAQILDNLNKERRFIESGMQEQALQALNKLQLNKTALPKGLCLFDDSWHQGVIGILAGRIKDKYHRPVIAFAKVNDKELKGSARSILGVHIRDVLDAIATKNPGLIQKFGGHAMAAGLSLDIAQLPQFTALFDSEIRSRVSDADLEQVIFTDGELNAEDFNLDLAQTLRDAEPWGQGFPEPLFENTFLVIDQRIVGTNHLKLLLRLESQSKPLDAIAFNIDLAKWPNHHCQRIHAVYKLDVNEYQGISKIQLLIEHMNAL